MRARLRGTGSGLTNNLHDNLYSLRGRRIDGGHISARGPVIIRTSRFLFVRAEKEGRNRLPAPSFIMEGRNNANAMADPHVDTELLPLVEGVLTGRQRQRVLEHVARCRRCRQRYDDLRFTHRLVAGLPRKELPAERALQVRVLLDGQPPRSSFARR